MIIVYLYKAIRKVKLEIQKIIDYTVTIVKFAGNNIIHDSFSTNGIPYIMVARGGKCLIGKNFTMNNGIEGNPIGVFNKCCFVVYSGATLRIGDNVGMSQTALVAYADITIENDVKIGGGVCIYTTDFHSIDPQIRKTKKDTKLKVVRSVLIKENAFIGAHSIILKGVTIGCNSVVGAGSIVTKDIPNNQVWAGNPAKFVRQISSNDEILGSPIDRT